MKKIITSLYIFASISSFTINANVSLPVNTVYQVKDIAGNIHDIRDYQDGFLHSKSFQFSNDILNITTDYKNSNVSQVILYNGQSIPLFSNKGIVIRASGGDMGGGG